MVLSLGPESGQQTTYANKQMATVVNPFSIRNNDPKWPDGLANYSKGVKRQFSSEVWGRDIVIALFPGKWNWVTAFHWDEAANVAPIVALHGESTEVTGIQAQVNFVNAGVTLKQDENSQYGMWRISGAALRIVTANSDQDSDGWFECIRTDRNVTRHKFGLFLNRKLSALKIPGANDNPVNPTGLLYAEPANGYRYEPYGRMAVYNGYTFPTQLTVQEWYSARNWALSPTYASGKLKTLNNYIFSLNNIRDDNPFKRTKNVHYDYGQSVYSEDTLKYWRFDRTRLPPYHDPSTVYNWNGNDQALAGFQVHFPYQEVGQEGHVPIAAPHIRDWNEFANDPSWDMIIIRIHGVDKTRLVLHSVSNLEYTASDISKLNRNLTVTYPCKEQLQSWKQQQAKIRRIPFFKPEGNWFD